MRALIAIVLCACSAAAISSRQSALSAPNGDARAAIQAEIDSCAASSCGEVHLEAGSYTLSRAGTAYYCLRIPAGIRLRGDGIGATVLQEAAGMAGGVRIFEVDGADVSIDSMTL